MFNKVPNIASSLSVTDFNDRPKVYVLQIKVVNDEIEVSQCFEMSFVTVRFANRTF